MIAGIFHEGSGLGNQLHRYVATRVLAEDKGYKWTVLNPHVFKGRIPTGGTFFTNFVYFDLEELIAPKWSQFQEKKVIENGVDIRGYDPEFNFVEDNTIIDGEFQDPRYFAHRMDDIAKWLAVEPLNVPDDVCVIGFRGGEYALYTDLYLPREYWDEAIGKMLEVNPNMQFEVHTDDPELAALRLNGMVPPDTTFTHDIGINWRSVRYAKYSIIANSSFYILPRLLAHRHYIQQTSRANPHGAVTIAPRYWARHNTKTWALPQNYYKEFTYI